MHLSQIIEAVAIVQAEADSSSRKTRETLEKSFGEEVANFALAQPELRTRAKSKFSNAEQMLFEREPLEQATHERIAQYHASQFPAGERVIDLTTGIGGDLLSLISRGPVIGFETDLRRAMIAQHNAALLGSVHNLEMRNEDGVAWLLSKRAATDSEIPDYVWADPHRRDGEGRRLIEPEDYSPNPVVLAELFRQTEISGIKLSPLLRDDFLASLGSKPIAIDDDGKVRPGPQEAKIEFVSYGRECREAVVWIGKQIQPGWQAIHLESGERLNRAELYNRVESPSRFLFDCDPAAVRAHALANFNIPQLGDAHGYLTGPDLLSSPWLSPYEVLFAGKADLKRTKAACRELKLSVYEVKQRAVKADAPLLLRELSKTDGSPVSLIVYPVGKSIRHVLARRIS